MFGYPLEEIHINIAFVFANKRRIIAGRSVRIRKKYGAPLPIRQKSRKIQKNLVMPISEW